MKKKRSILKEIGIVITISILLGLIVNFVNPSGIPLFMDESRYSEETSSHLMEEFLNNPTDTTSKSLPMHTKRNPEKTKEGYIKPQNIKLDFAKILYDKNALFIDGRTAEEFNAGHIKNAINLPYTNFANKPEEEKIEIMKKYNKDGIIVCYCDGGSCDISIDLAYEIAKLGFNSVNIYLGGFKEWKDSGYPTNKD
jgi:rhodanese-related sulfurtransferase